MAKDIYIIDGARTPFLKSRNRPGPFAASDLAIAAGKAPGASLCPILNVVTEFD